MNRRIGIAGLSSAAALLVALAWTAAAGAAFGLSGYDVRFEQEDGTPASLAGSHPFSLTTELSFNKKIDGLGREVTDGLPKDITVTLPPGLTGDPNAAPRCSNSDFLFVPEGAGESNLRYTKCPDSTAVGFAELIIGYNGPGPFNSAVYNLHPLPGQVQRLGLVALGGVPVTIGVTVSEDPPYNVVAKVTNVSQIAFAYGSKITLWGNPASPAHDSLRGQCVAVLGNPVGSSNPSFGDCPVTTEEKPLLVLPGRCDGPLKTGLAVRSWEEQFNWIRVLSESHDNSEPPQPLGLSGCDELAFSPAIDFRPTSSAGQSPTGLEFGLEVEDEGLLDLDGRAAATIKRTEVTLPEGFSVNPSGGEGLASCSRADLGRETARSAPGEGCPSASKIGSVEVETPILDDPINGSIYVATPFDNEAGGGLIGLYMVLKSAKYGISIKQPLEVMLDPVDGTLTTVADDLPQQPLSNVRLRFREGPRSPLTTPEACGSYRADAVMTPWSGGPQFSTDSVFEIVTGPANGPCPTGAGPFAPAFEAGSLNPLAGAYAPFVLNLSRENGSQKLGSVATTLPPGMIGKLAGLDRCSEAQIALAAGRSAPGQGALELASPACPPGSEVGLVRVGAGSGAPAYVTGRAYLAGPYKGGPLSLAIVTPALSGPFDLGTVVVRVVLRVDSRTAQISAVSDPIPSIIAGIPLDVRSVAVEMNRPGFTLNPTNCEPMAVTGIAYSLLGGVAPLSERFQVGGCAALGFKPELRLRLEGGTKRGAHPALRAVLRPRPGDANIGRAVVRLPRSAFLDQAHIRTICTRVQFAAGAGHGSQCPAGSRYGYARAWSPLLDGPAEGPVYLRSSDNTLPDLVVALRGPASAPVEVEVSARIDSKNQGIRSTFTGIPDLPVTHFELAMQGGRKGLIENSRNLCFKPKRNRANAVLAGQNGRRYAARPVVRAKDCAKKKRRKAK